MSTLNGGPGNIVTNGLVFYYDILNPQCYISGSSTINDINSIFNTGSVISCSYYNTPTGFLEFNGTSSVVNVNPTFFDTPTSLTVELWLRPGLNQPNAGMNPLGYADTTGTNSGTGIMIHNGSNSVYSFTASGSVRSNLATISSLNPGTWYQIVFTYDLSTTDFYGYRNSILNSITTCYSTYNVGSNFRLAIGKDARYPDSSPLRHYSGSIAIVKIYNRALSSQEVQQNYNALKGRFGL